MKKIALLAAICFVNIIVVSAAKAAVYGGIEFPEGAVSFADEVIRFEPLYSGGPAPTLNTNPQLALGVPEGLAVNKCTSLGRGGLIELAFTNNALINSGNSDHDLHIFEIGSDVEDTFVAIRPTAETAQLLGVQYDADNDGFYEIGKVYGSTASIDIDSVFPGFEPGQLVFDAVQLIDDYNEGNSSGNTVGADIDAVGAIGTFNLCSYYLVGDVNFDCAVDLVDFALMAANWLVDCNADSSDPACILAE